MNHHIDITHLCRNRKKNKDVSALLTMDHLCFLVSRMILFILEYAVRYLMVPGRVENWILLIDLSRCGLSMAASSAIRSLGVKNGGRVVAAEF